MRRSLVLGVQMARLVLYILDFQHVSFFLFFSFFFLIYSKTEVSFLSLKVDDLVFLLFLTEFSTFSPVP